MSIDAYVNFNGNCREAVEFYAQAFGVEKPNIMTFGETPPHPDYPLPEEAKSLVMHTRLMVEGSRIMFSDTFPGKPCVVGNNITLSVVSEDKDAIQAYYDKLKVGGTIVMELQETFWSEYYGQITDKFGIDWQFNLGTGGM